ncbi:LuxR family two component transcriptional regulator [Paenibacillus cellulosilyticus]|uniref:LuxR family two component transcriptional regulator n=1 Tax=Paenibacillus cellulosilyticus TaxID=375489 RepID=A0A2V2YQW5_9BACL|nr:response regulator transcription factor [Paenibacillus cellulosilyticus]PWV92109.1 LuxR family two component transcriptional regulator [Paenibacillus cellulosilyticus]QKS44218.1 response regulator transcription factor [Paenibacillus cellulosilyticus]
MIRVLLVDDHPSVGEGTKHMIEQDPDIQVTIVFSGIEALERIEQSMFDVMLFDLNMPVISGLELTKRVIASDPDAVVLIYTGYDLATHYNMLLDAGVSGFISKASTREQLITAIRCALRGEAVVPVQLLKQLRRSEVRFQQSDGKVIEEVSINEKEQLILREVATGGSNKEIAAKLFMSQRTVEYNLTRIFEKLNVRSRSEAIVEAGRLGLINERDITYNV